MTRRLRRRELFQVILSCALVAMTASSATAQIDANERAFPQSKAAVEKTLKTMLAALAGRLPTLEGFAASDHPLDRYQRGYYQASVQITPAPTGGSVVRVSVKVTAWYSDPVGARSGYQLLNSNGRLEADLLDQLGEQLAKVALPPSDEVANSERKSDQTVAALNTYPRPSAEKPVTNANEPHPATSPTVSTAAPRVSAPTTSSTSAAASASSAASVSTPSEPNNNPSSPFNQTLAAQDRALPRPLANTAPLTTDRQLQSEIESLQEILKNQTHPKNLVAVKKSGTPVVATPSLNAKPLFLASLHDEFEMLEFNRDWVHIRISGLSRGWIWRNSLEMPDGISDTTEASGPAMAADLFHVTREETAIFPGDWPPLRGKSVKIISVQKVDEARQEDGSQNKMEYAKYLLDKNYAEMRDKLQDLAGIVLIFDSADGGMIAATLPTLQQWKAGTMSDAALWHNCFFDPPEIFNSASSSGTQ
jgi:hypothetical protein